MKYDLGTVDIPTIVANRNTSGDRYTLEFDSPPNAEPGETYRTRYSPLSVSCDCGAFLALWRDGNTLYVKALHGWTPTNSHVIAP